MKRSKNLAILLMAAGLATIAPLGCAKANVTATPTSQIVTVQQGPLLVQIPASGNLAFSQTADLAFQGAGTIDQISVKVGDTVKKGQVLATLDQTKWQDNLTSLQQNVTAQQRKVLPLEKSLNTDNQNLQQALNTSQAADLQTALTSYNNANDYYKHVTDNYQGAQNVPNSQQIIDLAKSQLEMALTTLKSALAYSDSTQVSTARMTVAVDQKTVDDAKNAVTTAQQTLTDATAASPQITAPFDGIVTAIGSAKNPKTGQVATFTGGETVTKGTVGVSVADPNKFKAIVLINEADIYNVHIGSTATVQPLAAPTVSFPATVTAIAPTATVSSGVVNYKVTVDVTSPPPSAAGARSSQTDTSTPSTAFQLKSGLTVTVNVLVQSIPDAILVPNRAITRQGTQTVVKVLKADGTTETRTITAGPNTFTMTQVLSGLSAGEKVTVTQATVVTPTATRSGGGLFGR